MLEGADVAPADLVGVGVEMLVAEGLQPGEPLVDLGLPGDEGAERGLPVAGGPLGAKLPGDRLL